MLAVVLVAEEFERGRGEPFGLVDDEQFDPFGGVADYDVRDLADEAPVLCEEDVDSFSS